MPVRILHAYQAVCYAIIYGIFTLIYWQAGGTDERGNPYVYKVIDYGNDPKTAVAWIAFLIFATHLSPCCLVRVVQAKAINLSKLWLWSSFSNGTNYSWSEPPHIIQSVLFIGLGIFFKLYPAFCLLLNLQGEPLVN